MIGQNHFFLFSITILYTSWNSFNTLNNLDEVIKLISWIYKTPSYSSTIYYALSTISKLKQLIPERQCRIFFKIWRDKKQGFFFLFFSFIHKLHAEFLSLFHSPDEEIVPWPVQDSNFVSMMIVLMGLIFFIYSENNWK